MELDIELYSEDETNSFHTQNPDDKEFRRILVMTENARESPLTMKVTIKEVHYGKLKWERRSYEGALLLFHFQFKSKVRGRRYRWAHITLEFLDLEGKASHDPAVFKVAPEEDQSLNRTKWSRERTVGANASVKPACVDLGATINNKDTKCVKFSAKLKTDIHWSGKNSGFENAVTWSMEENDGEADGIPTFLQVAVLLRLTTTKPFRMQPRVRSGVDWKSNTQRLLPYKSDKDKIIDPVLLTPGTAQEGVDNSDITGITDQDLLAMEKLPMAKYFKILHPEEEVEKEGKE
jgi:hypothetical protein